MLWIIQIKWGKLGNFTFILSWGNPVTMIVAMLLYFSRNYNTTHIFVISFLKTNFHLWFQKFGKCTFTTPNATYFWYIDFVKKHSFIISKSRKYTFEPGAPLSWLFVWLWCMLNEFRNKYSKQMNSCTTL